MTLHEDPDRSVSWLHDGLDSGLDPDWPLPSSQAASLDAAIAAFAALPWLQDLVEDTGGLGLCVDISRTFVAFLEREGLIRWSDQGAGWDLESFDLDTGRSMDPIHDPTPPFRCGRSRSFLAPHPGYPRAPHDGTWQGRGWHCVVRVGATIIDFSARQFSPDLPFPFVWTTLPTSPAPPRCPLEPS